MYLLSAVQAPRLNWPDLFARARGAVQMKHETLARLMGLTPQLLSSQLAGTGHVSLFRLAEAATDPDGKEFVIALFELLAEELGFSQCDPVAETLGSALVVLGSLVGKMQLRMARPELPEKRRRSA